MRLGNDRGVQAIWLCRQQTLDCAPRRFEGRGEFFRQFAAGLCHASGPVPPPIPLRPVWDKHSNRRVFFAG